MAESARGMNASWSRAAFFLTACLLLLHRDAHCQDETAATAAATVSADEPTTAQNDAPVPTSGATSDRTQGPTVGADNEETIVTKAESASTVKADDGDDKSPQGQMTSLTTPGLPTGLENESVFATSGKTQGVAPTIPEKTDEEQTRVPLVEGAPPPNFEDSNIVCLDKKQVLDRDAVEVQLKVASSCENTKNILENLEAELCGEKCQLEIFQADNSNKLYISGNSVTADAKAMAEKFKQDDIREALKVQEATPVWSKRPPTVLVSLLVTGLLLAAGLIGGYCLKSHRANSTKSMRLAEEPYNADEENQGNTLVSVAPLNPPETQEKPNINGESPDGKNQVAPDGVGSATTNGHSANKTPVADTEL